jgi:hypothetical protein
VYTGPEGGDIPIGTTGETYTATTEFDGWGYVQLHDARDPNLRIIDSYAVDEALDEEFATGHGELSVHEVKTDPRRNVNLAYLSYVLRRRGAGGRVQQQEGPRREGVGERGGAPLLLFSDRDFGLYILRYDDDRRGDGDDDDDDDDDRRGGRDDDD